MIAHAQRDAREASLPARSVRLRFATRFRERLRGLLAQPPIARDEAMWIEPCAAIHTFGMRYAIDVVFVDREDRVLRIFRAVPPGRVRVVPFARAAVELAAGGASWLGWEEGERLRRSDRAHSTPDPVEAFLDALHGGTDLDAPKEST